MPTATQTPAPSASPVPKPAVLNILLAAKVFFGLGQNAAYRAAQRGELAPNIPVLRVAGKRFVVPTTAIETVLGIDLADYRQPLREEADNLADVQVLRDDLRAWLDASS